MKTILDRFYIVSEVFGDDERLMSIAIKERYSVKETKCKIYKELLNCKYGKWIDKLEEVSSDISKEWIEYKLFMIENGHDKVFLRGDMNMIEAMCNGNSDG